MYTSVFRRFSACFLALTVVLCCCPIAALSSGSEFPEAALPPETLTEETIAEDAPSEESLPGETLPEETFPEESLPEESLSEESLPEETLPEESLPKETLPEESFPEESLPEETFPETPAEPEPPSGPGLYFGLLNAHTDLSEGSGTLEDVFSFASRLPNMDFLAAADHSDSFDNSQAGIITADCTAVSTDWASGKTAAAAVSRSSFLGLFGYEMNWPSQMQVGHLSTFGTPGFQCWTQPPYDNYDGALDHYYDTLTLILESVSQFNHPGTQYGSFDSFRFYSEEADRAVCLLEIDFSSRDPLRHYIKALDRGWHLAPTAAQPIFAGSWEDPGVRTAVHTQSLSERDFLLALKQCRAYATEDPDLEILYSMDGYFMGSRLDLRHTGETADLSVTFQDPTDGAVGLVEIITNGAEIIAQQTLSTASGTLSFSLPPESGYYFLRITQPDGDLAVTAPIWIDGEETLGINSLTCEAAPPVQNEPVHLAMKLVNGESADFLVESLEILADGALVAEDTGLPSIPAQSTLSHSLTVSFGSVGLTRITVRLSGTLEGSPRCFEASLELNFRQSGQATAIFVDGSHGNAGLTQLNRLKAMALEETIRLSVETAEASAGTLKDCWFFLVSAPSQPFSDAFLSAAAEFAGFGGSLILCGQADTEEDAPHSALELNRLLEAIGSGIRLNTDTARDPVNNGGSNVLLNSDRIDRSLSWCAGISGNQVYRAAYSCTLTPGGGTPVVTGRSTTVSSAGSAGDVTLLACESLSGGGTVFVAGSLFLSDENLAQPETIWDEPYANRSIARNLLGIGGETLPLSTIQEARQGRQNELFRVRGYVTAGTSNPYNTFPDTLYLQDDTGGIAVVPFSGVSIPQGTPVEITGFAGTQDGSRILKLSTWEVLEGDLYQYQPLTGNWETLLDTGLNGGRFLQVEGSCHEIHCREDDTLASCLLVDEQGNTALVRIEDQIRNGSDGDNTLHRTIRKGRTVRAMGLLHTDEYGDTVVRVRNCEEVVWVPPRNYRNPLTADGPVLFFLLLMGSSFAGLYLLLHQKRT